MNLDPTEKLICINTNQLEGTLLQRIANDLYRVEIFPDLTNKISPNEINNCSFFVRVDSFFDEEQDQALIEFFNKHKSHILKSKFLIWTTNEISKELAFVNMAREFSDCVIFLNGDEFSLINISSSIHDFKTFQSDVKKVYYQVDSSILLTLTQNPCDIYLKLSEEKYIKILTRNDESALQEVITKYQKKSGENFFVLSNDYGGFQKVLFMELFLGQKNDTHNPTTALKISDSVLTLSSSLGISEFVIDSLQENIDSLFEESAKQKGLRELLLLFMNSNESLIGKHCHLTAIFCQLIAIKVPWANKQMRKNLSLASMLHDLELFDSPNPQIEFLYPSEIAINPASKPGDNHTFHTQSLVSKLQKNDHVPSDIITIINHHHEGLGEKGLAHHRLASQLSPMCCLFITAHTYAIELARALYNPDKQDQALQSTIEILKAKPYQEFLEILKKNISFT